MTEPPVRNRRCAVYTRKSSEEGLDQEFNSLDAQREACEAFVASQRHEGWILVPDRYDDGGFSGGTLDRPALKRLLKDVEHGLIDVLVVYKVDRLSRSLADFARMVEILERHEVSFVSITQQFNTTSSMGRLTLNILLSFAQFEREVIGERIRDKFAASRRKGMWMGGNPPLGYDIRDRKLVVNDAEAELVRLIFQRFLKTGSALRTAQELNEAGHTTKRWVSSTGRQHCGKPFRKGTVYKLLNNRVYLGEAVHKGQAYPGEHEAIIERETWDSVQSILSQSPRTRANRTRAQTPALLKGLIYGSDGKAMTPTHTRRNGRLYRYYRSIDAIRNGPGSCPVRCVAAAEVEEAVVGQVRALLRSPEIIARTWSAVCRQSDCAVPEREVLEAIVRFEPLWDELFPVEQARIVRLLVERVDLDPEGLEVRLRMEGLHSLIEELVRRGVDAGEKAA